MKYSEISRKWWVRFIPFLLSLISSTILVFIHNDRFKKSHPTLLGSVDSHQWIEYIALLLPPLLILLNFFQIEILKQIDKYKRPPIRTILALIDGINDAVSKKLECVGAQNRRKTGLPENGMPADPVNPTEQIKLLVRSVHQVFVTDSGFNDELTIKVTLARMNEHQIFDHFVCYQPYVLPPNVENLKSKNATFSVAAREGKIIIIPNIAKELNKGKRARYVRSHNADENSGSLIAYPLFSRHLEKSPLVLSIKCSAPKYFSDNAKNRYEFLIGPFAQRILLEYNNSLLEEKEI